MRTSVLPTALLAICFAVAPAVCFAQQPPASPTPADANDQLATIAGTVVSANTGEPLRKAHVALSQKGADWDDPNKQPLSTTTDAAGHFSIEKIPAGSYDLVVSRTNYIDARYGQDQADKPGAILSLAPGQKMADLLFRLHRTGIITGRVVDEDGDPIRGVNVMALLHTADRGKQKTLPHESDRTNDLGEYRIVDLQPGRYSICATVASNFFMIGGPSSQSVYLPTYYSGTTDSARASTLDVKSGDEISGIDFVLTPKPPARTYKIRGHVLNSLVDYPDAHIVVILFPRGNRELPFVSDQKQVVVNPKTGDFEMADVVPGEYIAAAFSYASAKMHHSTQNVDVNNADVNGISLVLSRGIDVPVRVTLDGKAAASATDVTVNLLPAEDTNIPFNMGSSATAQPDGTFILKEVADGSYSLRVHSRCQECYLKSANANGVDLLDQGVQLSSGGGLASIALIYSSNSGTATGTVTKKDDLPAAGATVVLVPDPGSHQKPEQYKTSNTDQYGHFEIRGVPPGHYQAFAWEKLEGVSYDDPAFLKPLESSAESFDIAANEQKSVQLKMIPAADSAN